MLRTLTFTHNSVFICQNHGKYLATPQSNNCPKCVPSKQDILRADFILKANKIHKNKYNYSEFIFIDDMTAGIIKCRKHGAFEISPIVHILHKFKCPKCSGLISVGETEWLDYLGVKERNGILFIGKKSVRPDGIDREKKIVYEYLGSYWHGNLNKYNADDINYKAKKTFGQLFKNTMKREELIKKAGYKLITIWDDEWEEIKKKLKIKSLRKKK